ncbi:MAG: CotH kinase family protein [Christensenellaceae bacterium]
MKRGTKCAFALALIWAIACMAVIVGCKGQEQTEAELQNYIVNDPITLSHEGGVYGGAFELTASPSDQANYLTYTQDGSMPTANSTRYQNGIRITDRTDTSDYPLMNAVNVVGYNVENPGCGTVIRFAEFTPKGEFVSARTVTYIINEAYASLSEEKKIPVICLTAPTELWFGNGIGFYNDVSNDERKERVEMEYYDASRAEAFAFNTQVKLGGNWTKYAYPKRTLNLNWKWADAEKTKKNPRLSSLGVQLFGERKAQDGSDLTDLTEIRLHSGGNGFALANFNDALSQEIASESETLSTTAYRPCLLFLNGECWGLYTMREHYNENYFSVNYGVDSHNVIYCDRTTDLDETQRYAFNVKSFDETDETITMDGVTYTHLAYAHRCLDELYEALTVPTESGELGLTLRDFGKEAGALERLEAVADVDGLIDLFLVEGYVGNWDFVYNNLRMWRVAVTEEGNPYGDGRWRFCLHDLDFSLESPSGTVNIAGGNVLESYIGLNGAYNYTSGPLSEMLSCLFAAPMSGEAFRTRVAERAEGIVRLFSYTEGSHAYEAYRDYKSVTVRYASFEYGRWSGEVHTKEHFLNCLNAIEDFLKKRGPVFEEQIEEFLQDAEKSWQKTDIDESCLALQEGELWLYSLGSPAEGTVYTGLKGVAGFEKEGVSFTFALKNSWSDWDNVIYTARVRLNTGTLSYLPTWTDWYETADDFYSESVAHRDRYWTKLLAFSPYADNRDIYIFVTVNCTEDGLEFYRNGEIVYRYSASAHGSNNASATIADLIRALNADVRETGFTFFGAGAESVRELYVGTGMTQEQARLVYERFGSGER